MKQHTRCASMTLNRRRRRLRQPQRLPHPQSRRQSRQRIAPGTLISFVPTRRRQHPPQPRQHIAPGPLISFVPTRRRQHPPSTPPTPIPPMDCPWDTHIGAYLCSNPPTPTPPSATPTPPSCSFSDIGLSRSYRSGSWTSSDCYSIRRSGGVKYVDYYTFTLTETTPVRIDLESLHDTYLYLIRGADPRGSTSSLEFDDDGGDGRNSRIQRTLNPGSYTIAATTFYSFDEATYKVRVYDVESPTTTPEATSTPTPPSEPTPEATSTPTPPPPTATTTPPTATTTPPTATTTPETSASCSTNEIDLSQSYRSGSWTPSDCDSIRREGTHVDYYTFTLAETTPVRIDLESSVDTYLYLIRGADPRSSTGTLESDDDSGHGRNSRIQRTLDPGSYTIAATTLGRDREGSYSVRVYNVDSTPPAPDYTSGAYSRVARLTR